MQVLVNIDVDDLDRATRFYCDALQLKVGRRLGSDGIELLGASALLYLLARTPGTPASDTCSQRRSYERHWTPVHLDFVVDDIEAAVRQAQTAGAVLEHPIRTDTWGKLALMADPFGHGFCFVQFLGRGYDELTK